jgi:tRNA-Thr(GGU) m(6)t(6)A37 methyltransferase TsaA
MGERVDLTAIGRVRSPIRDVVDDVWGGVTAWIDLDPGRFTPEALRGLDAFSHVEVLFHFDRVHEAEVVTAARHPRGRADWPAVGIFAQRARLRPNRLGVTICRLQAVSGLTVEVEGLDALDGTPVLDLKPVMREFGPRGEVRQPAWATELMAGYWKEPTR